MIIATWNINSIRLRIESVLDFVKKNNIKFIDIDESCRSNLDLLLNFLSPIIGLLFKKN